MTHSRGKFRGILDRLKKARRRAAPSAEALEERPLLAPFIFDPDGAGPLPASLVGGFDYGPGNALGDNAVPLTAGQTFQLYFQATLSGVIDANTGNTIAPPGLNQPGGFEITVVASITELVTGVSQTGGVASFTLAPTQAANSFFQLYFGAVNADSLAGTGFTDGTLILTGFPDGRVPNSSNFTVSQVPSVGPPPVTINFDQFGANNYPGIQTVRGSGSATLGGTVSTVDPAFFQTPGISAIAFGTQTEVPFSRTNPSAQFYDGSAIPLPAIVGPVNGAPILPGVFDFQFQADSSSNVSVAGINLVKRTNGTDNNTPTGPIVPVGSTVTFSYSVTNTGDNPLGTLLPNGTVGPFLNTALVDDNGTPGNPADDFSPTFIGGDIIANGFIDPGEVWLFTATRIATPGQYTNAAVVTGTDVIFFTTVADADVDNHFGNNPLINVVKLTNGTDNDTPPGVFVPAGSTVTFTYIVTNPGNVALSGVTVTDDGGTPGVPADDFTATFTGGDTNLNGLLDTTETWTFTATRIATPGQYSNIGTATGTDVNLGTAVSDTNPDNHFGATPAINVVKLTNGTDNDVAPGVFVPVGSTVIFTYNVSNPGNVPLANVTVVDDNGTPGNPADDFLATFVGGDTDGDGLLDPGETFIYTSTRIATAGQYSNVGTAVGTPPPGAGGPVTDTNPDNHFGATPAINVVKLTNGTDNDVAPGVFVPVGSTVTFTYLVTNPGNVPLSGVIVTDDGGTPGVPADDFTATFTGGDTDGDGLLDPGETFTYTATRIATAGQYTNVGTVTGTPPGGLTPVTDTNPDNHFGAAPAINVVKLTNGTDNDVAPGVFVPVGSTVTFTYLVTNPGNVPLSGVIVTDDGGTPGVPADDFTATFTGGDTDGDGLLDPGETFTYTATRIATAGQYTNVGTVTGTPPGGLPPVTDTNPDNHFGATPAINVVKLTNGTDNDVAPGVFVPVGSTVTFTYLVTNPGNVPLSGVIVRDDNGTPADLTDDFLATFTGGDTNGNSLLDTTETFTYTATRVATAGQYTNVGTSIGTPPPGAGGPVADTNPDNHFGATPAINVVKLTNGTDSDVAPGVFVPVGSTVTFTYLVTNPGNVPLSGVIVTDDGGTPGNPADDFTATFTGGDTDGDGLLDPGETFTYTATRIATAGQYTNVGTVTGTPPGGLPPVTDTNPDNHFGAAPGVNVVKLTNGTDSDVAPGVFVPVGSTVTFTYLVTNTGNVPLSGVTVTDDNGTPANPADDFPATFVGGDTNGNGLLDTTETFTYTASRIATAGQYTNVGTVIGTPPGGLPPVTDTNPDNHFGATPGINVVKLTNGTDNDTGDGLLVEVGSTLTFTYIVTNTGNVPLANVGVIDDNGTPLDPSDDFPATFVGGDTDGDGLLDTTETWTFTSSRIATPGPFINVGTVTGTPPGVLPPVTDTNPDINFGSAPGISIVKLTNGTDNNTAPGVFVPVGSTVTFTYLVTNTGNIPLSGVTVTDDNGTPGNPADDFPATFVGGDTDGDGLLDTTETFTLTATRTATAGQYTNVGTATGTPPIGLPVTATNPDNHFGSAPGIAIVKLTNGTDNNTAPGPIVPVGSTVTFTYLETNTGNVPLSGVTVVDDNGTPGNPADDFPATFVGGDTNGNGLLDTTETFTFTSTRVATPGQYTNFATVTGNPPPGGGPPVTATNPDNHFGSQPGLTIVKLTNGTDNNTPPGPIVPVGSTVTFTYLATNTGNVPLSGVTVTDDNGTPGNPADDRVLTASTGDTNGNGLLDPGETFTFTSTRVATPGQYTNFATATGTPPPGGGPPITTPPTPDNSFGSAPAINIVKLTNGQDANTPPGPQVAIGSTVVFIYSVTNPGNVPLSGVTVRDDNGTPGNPADDFNATFTGGDTDGDGLLDPGETWTFSASRIATAGQYTNVGTATGTPPPGGGAPVTDNDVSNHVGSNVTVVDDLERRGIHRQPTELVLTFSTALDPASAQDVNNYSIVQAGADRTLGTRDDRPIPVSAAVYDLAAQTVTLRINPRHINLRTLTRLTVRATPPGGVTNAAGVLIDGNRDGQPGGDFVADFQGIGVVTISPQGAVTTAPSPSTTPNANRFFPISFTLSPPAVDHALRRGGLIRLRRRARR